MSVLSFSFYGSNIPVFCVSGPLSANINTQQRGIMGTAELSTF